MKLSLYSENKMLHKPAIRKHIEWLTSSTVCAVKLIHVCNINSPITVPGCGTPSFCGHLGTCLKAIMIN